jgi:hypothetical protein
MLKAYGFGIASISCFVSIQIFVKMLSTVISISQILQIRGFTLLLFNSFLICIDPGYSGNQAIN